MLWRYGWRHGVDWVDTTHWLLLLLLLWLLLGLLLLLLRRRRSSRIVHLIASRLLLRLG